MSDGLWFTDPGALERATCDVCGAPCNIERNAYGPTCFAAAIARQKRLHDVIVCPHRERRWHERACELRRAIAETPSPRVAALMRADLDDILARRRR